MKKILSLVLCVLMLASVMSVLAGCGAKTVVGTWTGKLDMSDYVETGLNTMSEDNDIFKIDKFDIGMTFTFNEDGTYSVSVNKDSITSALDGIKGNLKDGMNTYLEQTAKANGSTVDELLAATGSSIDDLVDMVLAQIDVDDMADQMKSDGKYKAEDGKLYMSDSKDEDIDEDEYFTYELSSKELKLVTYVGDDDNGMADAVMPIVLTK